MEQGVPGSQNEHFFELLHPNANPPPPVASTPVDSVADGSPPPDPSSLHTVTPSYDFHLVHAAKSGELSAKLDDAPPPVLPRASSVASSGDHHQGTSIDTSRGLAYVRPLDAIYAGDIVTMDAIESTLKRYTDNLLQVLERVNGRLLQLETTVQGVELTIAGLKAAEGEKQDESNGRLMKLELLIEEVHRGIQLLHEKQSLDEAKSNLSKLHLDDQKLAGDGVRQAPHGERWQQTPKSAKEDHPPAAYLESHPQLPPHLPPQYPPSVQSQYSHTPPPPQMQPFVTSQSMLPSPSTMNGPPANQQPFPPHMPHLAPQHQHTSQPPPQNSLQNPAFHPQPAPQPPPPSSYNIPTETTGYSHMQHTHHLPQPPVPPISSYEPSQYGGVMYGGPRQPSTPQEVLHFSQQHNPMGSQHNYDTNNGRMGPMGSSMPQTYEQPPLPKPGTPAPSIYETASSGGYGAPPYRSAQPVPSAPSGGGARYPRVPTAQPIQHSLPAASPISSGTSMRSPIDDVIDKVVSMGFHPEQVKGVVRHLMENGQPADFNTVLDKLTNGGDSARGWFNRG